MAAARDALQLPAAPPAALLFSNRTIAALARELIMADASIGPAALPLCLHRSWPDQTRPLSANQQQMWWLRELAGASAYNMPLIIAVDGLLDVHLLQQALHVVTARHEVLRMSFEEGDTGVVGIVIPEDAAALQLKWRESRGAAETTAVLQQEISAQFDLAAAPPIRGLMISSSDQEHVLCLTVHHIAMDGWSTAVLWKELSTAYTALVAGRVPKLPPLPVQYSDYAAWQQEVLASDQADQWRSYWREALLGAPALLQLPCDRPRPAEPTFSGASLDLHLPPALEVALQRQAAELGINMQAVLLGTLQVWLTVH
jgi:hypothetical protein